MHGAGTSIRSAAALPALMVFLCWSPFAGSARAEDRAEDEPPQAPLFTLDRLDAYLELEAEYTRDRVSYDSRKPNRLHRSQTNTDWGFQEGLGLGFEGTVIDPGVLIYQGDVTFSLTQDHYRERYRSRTDEDNDTGHLLEYDLRLNLFQGKPVSGTVYGLRRDDRIDRRFQPTLDERRTGFGTSWYYAGEKLSLDLSYDYLDTDRTGNRRGWDDEHLTESTLHLGAEYGFTDHHRIKFSYEHAESKQQYQGLHIPFETDRDLFTIEHELEFGQDYRHELRTLIHWQEESGDFARDFFEIGPQLTLRHSDSLQTIYKYQFNREKYDGYDVETHRADFQLVHQLYSNLTTTLDVFGLYENTDLDVDTTQYGASVDWQYNRKNPLGHFHANLALGYDTEHIRGDNGVRVVLDESATFFDPVPVTLRNRNVIRGSILVTDTTNRRVFIPGVDYVAYWQRDVVRLSRIPTGRIADRDTVLIDYSYRTPSDGQVDTMRVDLNLEQRFDFGLTPYYRFSYRNQEVDQSRGFYRGADRTDHHRIGVKYERDRFNLGAEYEVFDDTVEPYQAFHLDGLLHVFQNAEHTLDASTRFSRYFFEGGWDDRNVNILDAELDHRWRLREDLSTFGRLAYRWEDDSVDGITHAWDLGTGLDYVIGDLTVQVSLEYDRLDLPESIEDDVGVYVRLRRDFPNVLGGQ